MVNCIKKIFCRALLLFFVDPHVLHAMEMQVESNKPTESYLEEASKNKCRCYLHYEKDLSIGWPVDCFLFKVNEQFDIVAPNFDAVDKQKALLVALNYFYLKLAKSKFDIRYLEKVMIGNYETRDLIFFKQDNRYNRFVKTKMTVNQSYSKRITINQLLNDDKGTVKLYVISDLLPKLSPEDQDVYKREIVHLASALLAPPPHCKTGSRHVYLTGGFKHTVEKFNKKVESALNGEIDQIDDQTKDEQPCEIKELFTDKDEVCKKPFPKYKCNNFRNIIGGLSFGLNCVFVAKYFLHDYLQENPKFVVPLLGFSTVIGGLSGFALSQYFRKK